MSGFVIENNNDLSGKVDEVIVKNKPRSLRLRGKKSQGKKGNSPKIRIKWEYVILFIVIILPYAGMYFLKSHYENKLSEIQKGGIIIINKEDMSLSLIDIKGRPIMHTGIACGKNYGNKMKEGDMRTPEGTFRISQIQDASTWKHDFGDGNGEIKNAYGPFFFRLETPGHKGIGIHGTHAPNSIGTRATEGCIRLHNEDVLSLRELVYVGMPVVILPSLSDMAQNITNNAENNLQLKTE